MQFEIDLNESAFNSSGGVLKTLFILKSGKNYLGQYFSGFKPMAGVCDVTQNPINLANIHFYIAYINSSK